MPDITTVSVTATTSTPSTTNASTFPRAHEAKLSKAVEDRLTAKLFTIPRPGEKGYFPELALLMERVNKMLGVEGAFYLTMARKRARKPKLQLVLHSRKATKTQPRVFRLIYSLPK